MSRIEDAISKWANRAGADKSPRTVSKVQQTAQSAPPSIKINRPTTPGSVDDHIISFHAPRSGLTESFKQIRIVIQNMLPEGDNKIIMFTSSYGAEGKTTASLNYAAAVAQDMSKRVLVVDADLREPRVHTLLGIRPRQGFGDLLMSDAPAESVICSTPIPNLSAILCGERPSNPSELFGTERVGEIFAELKSKYDCVIVDTPPVLPVVDTVHMASYADGVILVIEAARTSRKRIQQAIQLLNNANASVMGFLLNKGHMATASYYALAY